MKLSPDNRKPQSYVYLGHYKNCSKSPKLKNVLNKINRGALTTRRPASTCAGSGFRAIEPSRRKWFWPAFATTRPSTTTSPTTSQSLSDIPERQMQGQPDQQNFGFALDLYVARLFTRTKFKSTSVRSWRGSLKIIIALL